MEEKEKKKDRNFSENYIELEDFLQKKDETTSKVFDNFKKYGYNVIKLDSEALQKVEKLRKYQDEFFSGSLEDKHRSIFWYRRKYQYYPNRKEGIRVF